MERSRVLLGSQGRDLYRLVASARGGELLVISKALQSGVYTDVLGVVSTPLSAVFDMQRADLSSVNPLFGNESVLMVGVRPDGVTQAAVILRNKTEDPRTKPVILLPVIGAPGELFVRIGSWDGAVFVLEASSRSIFAWVDGDEDSNPELRLPGLFSFTEEEINETYVEGIYKAPVGLAACALLRYRVGLMGTIPGLVVAQGGAMELQDVIIHASQVEHPAKSIVCRMHAGMSRAHFRASVGDVIEFQRKPQGGVTFGPWGSTFVTATEPEWSPIARPTLVAGDCLRMIVNGSVVDERVVDADTQMEFYSRFPDSSTFRSHGATLTGDNFAQVAQVSWAAETDGDGPVRQEVATTANGVLSVVVAPCGTQMTIPAISSLPSFEGCFKLQFIDHNGQALNSPFIFSL